MATAGHSFSIYANSSLRPPINPKTGFSATSVDLVGRQNGFRRNEADSTSQPDATLLSPADGPTVNQLDEPADLTQLPDEVFYQKLVQLKQAHKKTLEMYEQLYTEKQEGNSVPKSIEAGQITRSHLASLENLLDDSATVAWNGSTQVVSAAKPPSGRPHVSEGLPTQSSAPRTYNGSELGSEAGSFRQHSVMSGGDGNDYETSEEDRSKENHVSSASRAHLDTKQTAMGRIDDMWDHFSVDNYCPRSSSRAVPGMFRSSSLSRLHSASRDRYQMATVDRMWASKKKTTTPRPFSMSVREANRTPRKSKVAIELEQREEEKRRNEELECQKKFKAMPLPAHVHLRLFDELSEERESRRRYIMQHRQELLKTVQKPFQFTVREEALKQNRSSLSASCDSKRQSRSRFRANPFPSKIFDDSVVEKISEEEEYRKIRNKMRAKELLRSSSLPPTMRLRGQDYVDGHKRQKLYAERSKKAGITVEHKFKPKINHTIPDFDKLYDNFMRDLTERKNYQREPTVCQPFNLRTSTETFKKSRTSLKNEDDYSDANDSYNQSQKSFRSTLPLTRSFAGSGTYTPPSDVIPSKTTKHTELRSSANRLRMQKKLEAELAEKRRLEQLHGTSKQLKKAVAERTLQIDRKTVHNEINEKTSRRLVEDQKRTSDYKRQLREMNQRLQQRPLLFEQTAQRNARQKAEQKYSEALSKAGVDVEFLSQRSSVGGGAASIGSRVADDDDDASYVASRRQSSARASPDRYSPVSRSSRDPGTPSHKSRTASGADYTQEYDDDNDDDQSNISEQLDDDEDN